MPGPENFERLVKGIRELATLFQPVQTIAQLIQIVQGCLYSRLVNQWFSLLHRGSVRKVMYSHS